MRISILILVIYTGLSSCTERIISPDIVILGHAGEGVDYLQTHTEPNSFSSIVAAIELYRLDGVEVDVQFTGDMIPILYHDKYLEESTTGEGVVYEVQYTDISQILYRGKDEGIVKLTELLEYCQSMDSFRISLNMKNYDPFFDLDWAAWQLDSILRSYDLTSKVYVESPNIPFLQALKNRNKETPCLLNGEVSKTDRARILEAGLDGVVTHFTTAMPDEIVLFHQEGLMVVTYGQFTEGDMRSPSSLNSDVLQVDNPIAAQRFRD